MHCSKAISYGIWHPDLSRVEVTVMKGIHFSSMGHSAPRSMVDEDGVESLQKRLELLPEEAIYLIERGTMFCWKELDIRLEGSFVPSRDGHSVSPLNSSRPTSSSSPYQIFYRLHKPSTPFKKPSPPLQIGSRQVSPRINACSHLAAQERLKNYQISSASYQNSHFHYHVKTPFE